jgi:hypothetical protein
MRRVIVVFVVLAGASCDPCEGSQEVEGVVHDQNGVAVAGATVEQCWYHATSCRSTTTDAAGYFRLDVQMDGPASDDYCVLRPIEITRPGCTTVTLKLDANNEVSHVDAGVVVLQC